MKAQFRKRGAQVVAAPLKIEVAPEVEDAQAVRELGDTLMQNTEVRINSVS